MHFGDRDLGCVGMVSMLPDMVVVAGGLAMAFKMRGERRVALTFFGEGSTANGEWHEAMNFAGHPPPAGRLRPREQPASPTRPRTSRVRGRPGRARAHATGSRAWPSTATTSRRSSAPSRPRVERARARRRPDADRGPDDADARPRRPRRHELCPAGAARGVGAARPDRALRRASASSEGSTPTRSRRSTPRPRQVDEAPSGRSPRRCPIPAAALEGVFADEWEPLGDGEARRERRQARCRPRTSRRAELTYLQAISEGLREEMRARRLGLLPRRGHRRLRRRLQGHRRLHRGVRRRARARHAARRERDHRRGDRRRGRGHEAGLRDAVRRLHLLRLRPARQRGGQAALPPGDRGADGGAAALRRRLLGRPVPLAEPRGVVPAGARPEGRRAGDRRRRQGPADERDPRPQPGLLPRAQGALPPRQGRGPRGRAHGPDRRGAHRPRGRRRDRDRLRLGGPPRARGGGGRSARRSRCSTCGRSARSTARRSSRASRKTGKVLVAHEATRPAASAPRSLRRSRTRRSSSSTRRSAG